jgi:sigma-E factor negative regulatory protein RseC
MREKATVTDIRGNKAEVTVGRTTACDSCGKCMIGKENQTVHALVDNPIGAKIGDIVDVEIEFGSMMSASFVAYGIPFLAFFAGALLGYYILGGTFGLNGNVMGLILGFGFIGISYLVIHALDKKGRFKQSFKIKIVEKE